MSAFIQLCSTFISGCAEFFNIPFPGLGGTITFLHVFVAFLCGHVVLSTVKIVFGVPDSGSSDEPIPKHYGGKHFVYRRGNRTAKDYGFKEIN